MKSGLIFGLILLGVFGAGYLYTASQPVSQTVPSGQGGEFQCAGKIYCSQMTSCKEALFYLKNCPDTRMDGDGDKVPCEKEWCGHSISDENNFK